MSLSDKMSKMQNDMKKAAEPRGAIGGAMSAMRAKQQQRQAARTQTVVPKPSRPAGSFRRVPPAAQVKDEALLGQIQSVQDDFEEADKEAQLNPIYEAIGKIEDLFTNLPSRLDSLRDRRFVHSANLEERLEKLDNEWDGRIRPKLEQELKSVLQRLDGELDTVGQQISRIGQISTAAALTPLQSAVSRVKERVDQANSNLSNIYQGIENGLSEMESEIGRAEWMIGQLAESEVQLLDAEAPILAVEAEWEQDGQDEGPDGILYLTDQRLIFEQKETIATKKFLFITTQSEKVQKVLLDIQVNDIEDVKHAEEGRGFLGMRSDDILELVCSSRAMVSRVRLHLKGQDSSLWAGMIKQVRSGEIDKFRAERFVAEIEEAQAAAGSFPKQCPGCYADVPVQPRGTKSYTCEFCGRLITP